MRLRPGAQAEYRRRHDRAWRELIAAIRSAGVHSFTVYGAGDKRFVHSELSDPAAWRRAWTTDVHIRWALDMAPLIEHRADGTPAIDDLDEIFHLERS
jgi:L-rhamnose mutarotase